MIFTDEINVIRCTNDEGITFGELREFIDKTKDIPNDTQLLLHTLDHSKESKIIDIRANEDSIIFYNW